MLLPGPGVTDSLYFFFSIPSPFPFCLSFSLCLSLFAFLGFEEDEGALWRKKSLCLKSLCVFDGGWDPLVAGTEGLLLLLLLVFPGLTLHDPAPPLQLLAGCWTFSLTLPLPPTPPSLMSFLVLIPLSSTRTFLGGGGGWKSREGCERLSGVPLASLGLTSGLLAKATAGAPAEAAAGAPQRWAEPSAAAILRLLPLFTLFPQRPRLLFFFFFALRTSRQWNGRDLGLNDREGGGGATSWLTRAGRGLMYYVNSQI